MAEPTRNAELVFIPAPGVGHLVSIVEFGRRLIEREPRFSITILIINMPNTTLISDFVRSRAHVSPAIRFQEIPMAPPPSPETAQTPEGFVSLFIQNHRPLIKQAVTDLIASSVRVVGFIIDLFCTPMIDVANEFGKPFHVFYTSPAGFLGFMLHLPTLDAQITGEFDESGKDLIIPCFKNPLNPNLMPSSMLKRQLDGYYWFLYHGRRYREAKGIIVNTFSDLEPHALGSISSDKTVPPLYPVGPLLELGAGGGGGSGGKRKEEHDKIMSFLDDQPESSVVFLCFGSMGTLPEEQVTQIAYGLERSGYRFLWSLRQPGKVPMSLPTDYENIEDGVPEGFLKRTAGVGLVVGWVPQVAVLAHKAVGAFVSHCGWNSILESVWHGVPIATWPLYGEQQMNAFELVKEVGLSAEVRIDYRLGSELVSADELAKALKNVMEDHDGVRKKAKEMSEKCRKALEPNGSSDTSLTDVTKVLASYI